MSEITIDIWSDIICPWCWIGQVRLEKALGQLPWRGDVAIRHRSFRLMPGQAPVPVMTIMTRKTNGDVAQVRRMFSQVEETARREGLSFALEQTIAGDTMDAHRLVKLATTKDKAHGLLEALYRAHMTNGRSGFDHAVLRDVAIKAGLRREDVDAVLAGDAYRDAVVADQRSLDGLNVQGVPFYVIDSKRAISGAQPIEVFVEALRAAQRERPAPDILDVMVCGPEGCA